MVSLCGDGCEEKRCIEEQAPKHESVPWPIGWHTGVVAAVVAVLSCLSLRGCKIGTLVIVGQCCGGVAVMVAGDRWVASAVMEVAALVRAQ